MSLPMQNKGAFHAERGRYAPVVPVTHLCQSRWSIDERLVVSFPSRKQVADRGTVPRTCHCIVKVCPRPPGRNGRVG